MPDADAETVLQFWLHEVGEKRWYEQGDPLDRMIRDRFEDLWNSARAGRLNGWTCAARGTLAFLIVTDQFPRNMFRDDPRAFATDRMALSACVPAIYRHWDLTVAEPERQFFYLPLMHSENLADQDHCVRLMLTRLTGSGADNLRHARAHREVIRKFGRFPYRNKALGRESSPAEAAFMEQGGYARFIREMPA